MSSINYYNDNINFGEYGTIYKQSGITKEGFVDNPAPTNTLPITTLTKTDIDILNKMIPPSTQLSKNIGQITNSDSTGLRDQLLSDDKYDYRGSLLLYKKPQKNIGDAVKEDSAILLLQENSMLILGSITLSTLFIFLLVASND